MRPNQFLRFGSGRWLTGGWLLVAVIAIVTVPPNCFGQDENGANETQLTVAEQLLKRQLRSPRATFETFVKAMEERGPRSGSPVFGTHSPGS